MIKHFIWKVICTMKSSGWISHMWPPILIIFHLPLVVSQYECPGIIWRVSSSFTWPLSSWCQNFLQPPSISSVVSIFKFSTLGVGAYESGWRARCGCGLHYSSYCPPGCPPALSVHSRVYSKQNQREKHRNFRNSAHPHGCYLRCHPGHHVFRQGPSLVTD